MAAGGIKSAARARRSKRASAAALSKETEKISASRLRLLNNVASTIASCIDDIAAAQLHETAALLAIARLDLLVHTSGITEMELKQLELVLDRARHGFKRVMPKTLRHRLAARTHRRNKPAAG